MKIISINVGQPREVEWRGQKVSTSIWKQPVQGRVFASRTNLEGDAQADLAAHGGEHRAVMVYQVASYSYWSDRLNRNDFTYGQFGENLTVEGLADDEVCIGDRYRIGKAIFEVTQPRVTCFKVGIRFSLPEMPALLVAHKRPGFYFRVIQEGDVGADDLIEKIADGPGQMTVAAVDALLYSRSHPSDKIKLALQIPALSMGWRGSFQEMLDAAERGIQSGNAGLSGAASRPAAWPGFRPVLVRATRQESDGVRSFELALDDGSNLPDALPGQHIAIKFKPANSVAPIIRMYSLCGPTGIGTYRIAVKREENGIGSGYLHEHMHEGDHLDISAPRGTFTLAEGSAPLVLLSAGIGITPVLAMLHAIATSKSAPARDVWWIHSAQNRSHHAFAEEVTSLITGNPSIRRIRIYSRPTDEERIGRDYEVKGHLDLALLRDLGLPQHGDFYFCGPESYLKNVTDELKTYGVPDARIHFEAFSSSTGSTSPNGIKPHLPSDNVGVGPIVTFTRSGISFPWNSRFQSLLEAAEACDVPVQWSCRSGVCHRCESGLVDGQVEYSPTPLDPPATGNLLLCCSFPISPVEIDL